MAVVQRSETSSRYREEDSPLGGKTVTFEFNSIPGKVGTFIYVQSEQIGARGITFYAPKNILEDLVGRAELWNAIEQHIGHIIPEDERFMYQAQDHQDPFRPNEPPTQQKFFVPFD